MSFFNEMERFRCASVFATLANKLSLMCILAHPKRIKPTISKQFFLPIS